MKYEEVIKKIHSVPAGQFINIETAKTLKVRKEYRGNTVTKHSHKTVRFGVKYENMKSTKEGRANGSLPAVNAGLRWGNWKPGEENYIIENNGSTYLRCATSPNKGKNYYFINGVLSSKEEAEKMCLASEFAKPKKDGKEAKKPPVLCIKTDSIISIGKD